MTGHGKSMDTLAEQLAKVTKDLAAAGEKHREIEAGLRKKKDKVPTAARTPPHASGACTANCSTR